MTVVCHCVVPQFEFIGFVTAEACVFFRRRPLSFTVCYKSTLPNARGIPVQQILFHGVMTPSLKFVGPGF